MVRATFLKMAMAASLVASLPEPAKGAQLRALQVLDVAPVRFVANRDIRLTVEPADIGDERFQVRVFRGKRSELPSLGIPNPDGCVQYRTQIFRPPYRRGDRQVFVTTTDRSWLALAGQRGYASQTFLLVFESGGPRAPVIRIAQRDLSDYFSRGVEIVVEPDDYLPALVAEETRRAKGGYDTYVRSVPRPQGDCYELLAHAGSDAVELTECLPLSVEYPLSGVRTCAESRHVMTADRSFLGIENRTNVTIGSDRVVFAVSFVPARMVTLVPAGG